tara:strand:+ start:7171 stop:7851 length:681 start_codon:yes stop_codon:yes gene_type:complete
MFSPEALLFDLDGVLLDTEPLHGKAWKQTAAVFQTHLTNTQLELLQGRRRHDCAQQLVDWIQKPIGIEDILKVHKPLSQELLKEAKAMPGAQEILIWCVKYKMPIALVTSSASSSVTSKTSPHPWLDCFLTRVQGDDPSLTAGKPSPEPYLLGAKKLKKHPNKCWAIEDSISGTQSAIAAGCQVWVLRNNANKKIEQMNLNNQTNKPIFIDNLNALLNKLKTLQKN